MFDFTTLTDAMNKKMATKTSDTTSLFNILEKQYFDYVETSMCGGATEFLDAIEDSVSLMSIESSNIPMTAFEMLSEEE